MADSPIDQLLHALDQLDIDLVMASFAPGCRLLTADGHRAEGSDGVRQVMSEFLSSLRSTAHRVMDQWHVDDMWIAEVEADYELKDWLRLTAMPRAFFVRQSSDGVSELHVYGAHEHSLADHRTGEEGMWVGERWIPPL